MGKLFRVAACCIFFILFFSGESIAGKVKRESEEDENSLEKIIDNPDHPNYVGANWNNSDNKLKEAVEQMMKRVMPMVIRSSSSVELSGKCMQALFKMMLAVRQSKLWAFRCKCQIFFSFLVFIRRFDCMLKNLRRVFYCCLLLAKKIKALKIQINIYLKMFPKAF